MDKTERDRHVETGIAWNVAAGIYERVEEDDIAMLRSGKDSLFSHEHRFYVFQDEFGDCKLSELNLRNLLEKKAANYYLS